MQFLYNLLLLFLLLFCISSADAANAIKCRQQVTVMRAKRQTVDLSPQQQYQQRQRNLRETSSVVKPVVRFFVATPGQQVQQLQVNSGGGQQRFAFTSQQQQQHLHQFRLQQQQQRASSSQTQIPSNDQYSQSNSYLQRQQQQQFYNNTHFSRVGQQPQQQQQQFQAQPPQQFHQSQQQPLQFFKPQITTTPNRIFQYNNSNQQPTSRYAPQIAAQRQRESTPTPNQGNGADAPVLTPLLPSYSDEDDTPSNYTRLCERCCTPGQTPCQDCCDTNPLLSVAVLKSSAG
ncbi:PREDICTED: putative cyclin-dependent serine/threonine-protein kinase DDB_G0272797/DDB_G0274007 isoform X1 [Bactrocera latifrons]|uniref:putative cyclin-dependent serine/threonine-protein kinase DDB_G0272797/DDB_G0274007 isoform X1 n=1 Tax=Bactrocera latifrons TaxID=174628 RepID=UPI0008DCA1AC|nr:PREDICTED: putative cyclin-dependent serine/threonine-protein kinase DDB_G0272797/DDB_G0274007 isoform X1 [Bactrocera latifrons]